MELFASASSDDGDSIRVWDIHTGAELWSRKDGPSQPRTLVAIGEDVVVAAHAGKNEFRFWSFSNTATIPNQGRCSAMEKMECLATSSDGLYCVGGSASGKLYIWEVASGAMLRYWDAHYSAVTAVSFTDDNLCLVSAERHAYIRAWRVAEVVDVSERARSKQPSAFQVWTDHTLPVTDLSVGVGGAACRVFSASLDQSVKVWCLASGDLVATVVFPSKCMAVATDPAERDMYVGGSDGVIYPVSLAGAHLATDALPIRLLSQFGTGFVSVVRRPLRAAHVLIYATACVPSATPASHWEEKRGPASSIAFRGHKCAVATAQRS